MNRAIRRILAAGMTIIATIVLSASPASAHDDLVDSTPTDGSAASPHSEHAVNFRFSNDVLESAAFIAVLDPSGVDVSTGDPVITGDTVTRSYAPTEAGTYTASYRVTSSDGHPIEGSISFEHEAAPGAAQTAPGEGRATPVPEGSASSEESIRGTTVVVAIAVTALAAVLAIAVFRPKRRASRVTEGDS